MSESLSEEINSLSYDGLASAHKRGKSGDTTSLSSFSSDCRGGEGDRFSFVDDVVFGEGERVEEGERGEDLTVTGDGKGLFAFSSTTDDDSRSLPEFSTYRLSTLASSSWETSPRNTGFLFLSSLSLLGAVSRGSMGLRSTVDPDVVLSSTDDGSCFGFSTFSKRVITSCSWPTAPRNTGCISSSPSPSLLGSILGDAAPRNAGCSHNFSVSSGSSIVGSSGSEGFVISSVVALHSSLEVPFSFSSSYWAFRSSSAAAEYRYEISMEGAAPTFCLSDRTDLRDKALSCSVFLELARNCR
mmetsp:Transcript_10548/g.26615  ORF Transcript_10548/g.26615 Transcript_10548/m.26615 type:complete len:299 (+) Transcript_10548:502-1398(+)